MNHDIYYEIIIYKLYYIIIINWKIVSLDENENLFAKKIAFFVQNSLDYEF